MNNKMIRKIFHTFLISNIILINFFVYPNPAQAAVTNNGILFYGDTGFAGTLRVRTFTSPSTWGTAFSALSSSGSNILWVVAKTSPTRDEKIIGHLKVDGRLDVVTCTTGCNASGDFTERWNNPGTTATQDCDSAPTVDTCIRAFDIGYEALSGRAMVVYSDDTSDRVYYALWDGSSWSPNSTPGTPGVSNEIDLPNTAGTPQWIRVIPTGDNLADERSNRIMVLVSDTNDDLFSFYWDGNSFSSGDILETSLQNCSIAQCFDGNWQKNNTFILSYTDTSAMDIQYDRYVVGSGWDGPQQAYTMASNGQWIMSTADPTGTRILVTTSSQGNDTRSAVWRGDNETDGWTVCSSTDCPDTTTEVVSGMQASTAFERFNGEGLHVYNDAGTTLTNDYVTFTPSSTWSNTVSSGITMSDDALKTRVWGSTNSDDIMLIVEDVDCDLYARLWNGSSLETVATDIVANTSSYGVACPNLTQPGTDPGGAAFSYDFAWDIYSPWTRNWRFYDGSDTSATPTTALANENTTPTGFDGVNGKTRLRYSVIELTNNRPQTDARKKLQWTTGDPDSLTATWTDVDDVGGGGIWRYVDCNGSTGTCNDNTTLSGTVLSGSPTVGWWTQDKDVDNGGSGMDHSAGQLLELEYSIEANGASSNTTYYFRMFDLDQQTPVFREQDNDGSNDCASSTCTYPSLTTASVSSNPPTTNTNFAVPGATTATLHGTKTGGGDATQHGFAWGTNSGLSGGDTATTTLGSLNSNSAFISNLSGLSTGTTYYFRAYATNADGTGYGTIKSFVTGNTNVSRFFLLFEGSLFKLLEGRMIIHQR